MALTSEMHPSGGAGAMGAAAIEQVEGADGEASRPPNARRRKREVGSAPPGKSDDGGTPGARTVTTSLPDRYAELRASGLLCGRW